MEEKLYLEKDRIPVFIGKEGSMKKKFEEEFDCQVEIDSKTGEVLLESENALNTYIISHCIQAINAGHNPENTFLLKDENNVFDLIDVKSLVRDQHRLKSVMGRVIGKEGSTRKAIQEITKCLIAVQDTTVSVIGPFENVQLVHEALEMLIKGSSHKSFYSYLERNKISGDAGLL